MDWLEDWSRLVLNLLKPLLQVFKERVLRFEHLLDRWLVFTVSFRYGRVNLLGNNKGIVFLDSFTRLSDDASHHRVESLALVRQFSEPVCLSPDQLRAQTLRTSSPVSNSIWQRVPLGKLRWRRRSHKGVPARWGQVFGEGSVQGQRQSQLLHRGRRHLFLENSCHWGCRLRLCGSHGENQGGLGMIRENQGRLGSRASDLLPIWAALVSTSMRTS